MGGFVGSRFGTLFAYLLWNDASTFSDRYSGDAQGVTNIEAEQALRLYEFWYEHRLADGLSLKTGLYDLNSEFDAVDSAALFLNSSHGIVPTYFPDRRERAIDISGDVTVGAPAMGD